MLPLILFGLLVGLPILEVYTFIEVGRAISVWPTIGLVILTAVMGTTLIRWQGLTVLRRAQDNLAQGQVPVREVFDGVCLLVAGVLLLTPGFITDTMGFLLVLPPVRSLLLIFVVAGIQSGRIKVSGRWAGSTMFHHPSGSQGGFDPMENGPFGGGQSSRPHDVVDGDYRDVTDQPRRSPTDDDPSSTLPGQDRR